MLLDDIHALWEIDSKIKETDLSRESLAIPNLHNKYLKIFSEERILLKSLQHKKKTLQWIKYRYYRGILSEEELQEYGLEPFGLKLLKDDVQLYIDSDEAIQKIEAKIAIQEEKINTLDQIIKSLNNRGFLIKNAIDFLKFTGGV